MALCVGFVYSHLFSPRVRLCSLEQESLRYHLTFHNCHPHIDIGINKSDHRSPFSIHISILLLPQKKGVQHRWGPKRLWDGWNTSYEQRLRELGLLRQEKKRLQGNIIVVFQYLKEAYRKEWEKTFYHSLLQQVKLGGDVFKLKDLEDLDYK